MGIIFTIFRHFKELDVLFREFFTILGTKAQIFIRFAELWPENPSEFKESTFQLFYKRAWIEHYVYTFLYAKFDGVSLGFLSLLCTFQILQNGNKYRSIEISFSE